MRFRRVGCLAAIVLSMVLWAACGQVYRPVVLPCSEGGLPGCPVEAPPTPANFHAVFGITANVPDYPGGAMQIDVSGDSIIAETPTSDPSAPNLGDNPTFATVTPNNTHLFVAGAGSIYSGQQDTVVSFFSASILGTGFSPLVSTSLPSLAGQSSTITALSETGNLVTATLATPLLACPACDVPTPVLPPLGTSIVVAGENITGYNGTFALTSISAAGTTVTFTDPVAGLDACPSTVNLVNTPCTPGITLSIPGQPVYLASVENAEMYVANFNSNSVMQISTATDVVTKTATLEPATVTSTSPPPNPVAMAEANTPNGLKLYVGNQGTSTLSSLNTLDFSSNTVTGFTGIDPIWILGRADGQKVYVLAQGDGQLETIDTATDTVTGSVPVGVGANFIFYDPNLNRLYVTNPVTGTLYVFADTGGVSSTGALNDTPIQLAAISMAVASSPLCASTSGCSAIAPASVTALPDGSRFYVAGYQTATACPDPFIGTAVACLIPSVTVFNANNFALEYSTGSTLQLLTDPPFAANLSTNQYQFAVPLVSTCGPATPPSGPVLYSPSAPPRFRVFTTASVDSTRVYVSICDAGIIAVVDTSGGNIDNTGSTQIPADTVVTNLPGAFSAGPAQANGLPANQNPIFLVTGQ